MCAVSNFRNLPKQFLMGEPVEVKCVLCLTSKGTTYADPNKGSWWFLCNDCEPRARELIETAEA